MCFVLEKATRGGGVILLIQKHFAIIKSTCLSFGLTQAIYCDGEFIFYNIICLRTICVNHSLNSELAYSLSVFSALESVIANSPILPMVDLNLTIGLLNCLL